MGLLGALGAVFGGRKKSATGTEPVNALKKVAEQYKTTAPGPGTGTTETGMPKPPVIDNGADQAAALEAGKRARRKSALGGIQMRPFPKPGTLTPRLQPKTLIGGY